MPTLGVKTLQDRLTVNVTKALKEMTQTKIAQVCKLLRKKYKKNK